MAIVKKSGTGKIVGKNPVLKPNINFRDIELPTALSAPSNNLQDYSILLYGEKKIGKTSLAAQFPDTMFLMFEPGGRALRIYQRPVTRWEDFIGYLDLLEEDKKFKTIVVDTIDICYDMCFNYCCKKFGFEHPTDENDFGKSWGKIENEFVQQITRLLNLGKGVVLISHAVEREVKTRAGRKFWRMQASMPSQANKFLTGIIDIWAYYGYNDKERELTIRGDDYIGAGCRLEENFKTKDGDNVNTIYMGKNSKEAYKNLLSAFNNKMLNQFAFGDDENE